MMALILYAVKTLALAALFVSYYWLLLRNRRMHQFNRLFLLTAVVASLLLPLVHIDLYSVQATPSTLAYRLVEGAGPKETETIAATTPRYTQANWKMLLPWLYFIPFVLFVVRTTIQMYRLGRLKRKATAVVADGTPLAMVQLDGGPFSYFGTLYWCGETAPESEEGQAIIAHELVHIRQWHTADKLLMQAVTALFWFNPFFRIISAELSMTHEFIADNAMEQRSEGSLARVLLQAYFGAQYHTLVNPFFQSPIKRRIAMMQKTKKPRMALLRQLMVMPAAAVLVASLSFTVNRGTGNVAVVRAAKKMTIVVDAGHGGKDNGAVSAIGVNEKDVTLNIVKQLQAMAAEHNIEVRLTRPDDNYLSLEQRTEIANNSLGDVFVSIHVAAADEKDAHSKEFGICVAPRSVRYDESKLLASHLGARLNMVHERPYMFEKSLVVLRDSKKPSVAVECSNIDNSAIRNKEYVTAICHTLLNGIAEYGNSK